MARPPRIAYLYLDQSPLTIPAAHRADIKRPDFLVAVEGLGTVALDAKAKSFIDGCFVLDVSERRRLDGFESVFGTPVWYACFPSEEPGTSYLFRNRGLMGTAVHHKGGAISTPIVFGRAVLPRGPRPMAPKETAILEKWFGPHGRYPAVHLPTGQLRGI